MNRSSWFSLAAVRTRSSQGDTLTRPGVRRVSVWPAFPLAPALGSAASATAATAAFAGFPATMARSDFSAACIIGFGSHLPNADQTAIACGHSGDLPVPAQGACAHARVSDRAGSGGGSR